MLRLPAGKHASPLIGAVREYIDCADAAVSARPPNTPLPVAIGLLSARSFNDALNCTEALPLAFTNRACARSVFLSCSCWVSVTPCGPCACTGVCVCVCVCVWRCVEVRVCEGVLVFLWFLCVCESVSRYPGPWSGKSGMAT
jgi:hypothetical protein